MGWRQVELQRLISGVKSLTRRGSFLPESPLDRLQLGDFFCTGYYAEGVADGASIDLVLTTPETDHAHLTVGANPGASSQFLIYETPIYTGGTPLTFTNHKRYSSKEFAGSGVHSPSVSDPGTQIFGTFVAAGEKSSAGGANESYPHEWLLKSSEEYLFRLTNKSGQAMIGSVGLFFYMSPTISDD